MPPSCGTGQATKSSTKNAFGIPLMALLRMNSRELVSWVCQRTSQRFRAAVLFSLSFKLLQAALVIPIVAGSLRLLLQRWGRASVGNFEIAAFLLSPPGLAALIGVGTISLGSLYLELAGLMRLLADGRLRWWQALLASGRMIPRLLQLGARQFVFFLLMAVPFVLGIGLAYWMLWRGRDLNGLIHLRPPVFWWGVLLAGGLLLTYAVMAGRWFLKWILAVPATLFDSSISPPAALQWSVTRTAGQERRLLGLVLAWSLMQLLLHLAVLLALKWGASIALNMAGESLKTALPVTAALLVIFAVAGALLALVASLTFAGLTLALFREAAGNSSFDDNDQALQGTMRAPVLPWVVSGGLLLLAIATGALSHRLLAAVTLDDRLEITAHRAGASHAPENSVAALRQAIMDRADWAEIDVQLTRDNALVILHDIDLARIGGGNRRVDSVTFEELRALEIGTVVNEKFAGERVPTLEEMLATAGQEIRMNVELKPHGKADETALTEAVVTAIRKANMVDRCRICSQSYPSLQLARRLEPSLPIGFIAATSIGDLAELDVDFLMVKSELISRNLVERAAAHGMQVHAWTVNDSAWMSPLIDRGVANVITDDPARMRSRLDEIRSLSPLDRLLLRARSEFTNGRP